MKDRFLSEMWYFYNLFLFETTCAEEYFIQHYVITFVIDMRKVGCVLWVLQFPQTIQTNRHDIIQLSPFLECDPTVCLPEKRKVTQLFEGRQTVGSSLIYYRWPKCFEIFLIFPLIFETSSDWLYRIFLHQTPSNRIPTALQKYSITI
jgi:hypothetical protein